MIFTSLYVSSLSSLHQSYFLCKLIQKKKHWYSVQNNADTVLKMFKWFLLINDRELARSKSDVSKKMQPF